MKIAARKEEKEIQHMSIYIYECTPHTLLCTGGVEYFHRLDVTVRSGGKKTLWGGEIFFKNCSNSGQEIMVEKMEDYIHRPEVR